MRQLYWADRHASDFPATGRCLNCKSHLPKRHRKYCSEECSDAFYMNEIAPYIQDWGVIRMEILRRDRYLCVKCGGRAAEVDHVIALINGGGEFDKSNLQSLCRRCHAIKSGRDRKEANARTYTLKAKLTNQTLPPFLNAKGE